MCALKKCSKCLIEKEVSNFTKNLSSKDKLSYFCKECAKEIYIKNKLKIEEYRQKNLIKIKEQTTLYWKNNKEKLNEKQRLFYNKNKEKLNKITRKYYTDHSEELKFYQKQYKKKNLEKVRSLHRKIYHSKKINPEFKLKKIVQKLSILF
jgi:hypothetical protein